MYFDRTRLRALLKWYKQEVGKDLIAALIVDRDGLLVDSISRDPKENVEEKFIGAFGALVETILKKITKEFKLGLFGAGTFDTDKYRFIFCEAGTELILVSVFDALSMIDPYFAYSYLAAEKIARIFEGEDVSPVIPKIIVNKNLQNIERKISTLQQLRVYSEENVYKLILGGDGAVGKTSIVKRFTENTFKKNYKATIGTSISKKECHFEGLNSLVRFVIWDLAGQPQFKRIRPSYLANSGAGILVFDVTDRESFNNIKNWYREIRNDAPSNIFLILAGNKIDLKDQREVSHSEGKALAEELGISYIETSAKTGENINETFKMLALQLIQRFVKGEEIYKVITDSAKELKVEEMDKIPENCVKVPIDQVWKNVERDLVPWLANNIHALGDTIDFQLKTEENNNNNNQYKKELLAVDELGEKALILPQFKQTDYYHLGTLISKLATHDVKTVIWICEEVLNEYRKAIEWLNKNTLKDILFYLIELEILKSEEYQPFPRFKVIISPPQPLLARRMKKTDKTLTKKQKLIIDFWVALVDKPSFPNQTQIKITKTPQLSYPTKIKGCEFRYFVKDNSSGVQLHFNHENPVKNIERFKTLEEHKKKIEKRFKEIGWNLSEELEWDFQENRDHQVIQYILSGMGLVNKGNWNKTHLKLIDVMKSLKGAFSEKINSFFGDN